MLNDDNDLISVKIFVFKEAKEVLYENKKNEIKSSIYITEMKRDLTKT